MVLFEEARNIILTSVNTVGTERIPLLDTAGRVLAEDLIAPWDMPSWDYSAMDGYAVNTTDCAVFPCTLQVNGFMPAGSKPDSVRLKKGGAIRIMTGAPIPEGTNAVVPLEATDNGEKKVTLNDPVNKGDHIRFKGSDVAVGNVYALAGSIIRPPEVNMMASFGKTLVPVYRQPTVAILSTGDELIELGRTPGPGEIVNSNTMSMAIAVREAGAIPVIIGIARDHRESLKEKLQQGLKSDVLITSAGVSGGDLDLVRGVLEELGVQQVFWKVAVKPGGPTAFAMQGATPVFSLPGNPVSAMVTFEELVRPALLKMQGHRRVLRPIFKATLREEITKPAGKVHIIRIRLEREDGRWYASSAGSQHSAVLKTMVDAEALAILPAENTRYQTGDEVDVHFFGNRIDLV